MAMSQREKNLEAQFSLTTRSIVENSFILSTIPPGSLWQWALIFLQQTSRQLSVLSSGCTSQQSLRWSLVLNVSNQDCLPKKSWDGTIQAFKQALLFILPCPTADFYCKQQSPFLRHQPPSHKDLYPSFCSSFSQKPFSQASYYWDLTQWLWSP